MATDKLRDRAKEIIAAGRAALASCGEAGAAVELGKAAAAEELLALLDGPTRRGAAVVNRDEQACADVADALALLAAAARGGVSDRDPRSGTHGVAALVGAIILLARTSAHAPEVIRVAIDALELAQKTIRADQTTTNTGGT